MRSALAVLQARGLRASAEWVAEHLVATTDAELSEAKAPAVPALATPPSFIGPQRGGVIVSPLAIDASAVRPSDVAVLAVCYLQSGEFERAAFALERAYGGPPGAGTTVVLDAGGFAAPCVNGEPGTLLPLGPDGLCAHLAAPGAGGSGTWPTIDLCVWAHASLLGGERRANLRRLASGDPLKGPIVVEQLALEAATQPDPVSGAARAPLNPAAGVVMDALLPLWHSRQLDPPAACALGAALRRSGHRQQARAVLASAAVSMPLLWSAWTELADACAGPDDVPLLPTTHWAGSLFAARLLRASGRGSGALAALVHAAAPASPSASASSSSAAAAAAATAAAPSPAASPSSSRAPWSAEAPAGLALSRPYRTETALTLFSLRRAVAARSLLASLHADDPFDMSVMPHFSDCLFVTSRRAELAALAHRAHEAGRFRPEAALVLANHASIKGEHERAILHLKRALRADPASATAWTLLGHECMEAKNGPAAVEAYRRALDVSPLDHRAWHGLGQAHELFGLRLRALDAYRRAAAIRPTDGRMWTAMASVLEALGQKEEAKACYRRAASCPDGDGHAEAMLAQKSTRDDTAARTWAAAHRLAFESGGIGGPPELDGETMRRASNLVEAGEDALATGSSEDAGAHAEAAVALLGRGDDSGHRAAATLRREASQLLTKAQQATARQATARHELRAANAPRTSLMAWGSARRTDSGSGWAGLSRSGADEDEDMSTSG